MPFPSLVCAVIETTINQLLTLDASADHRIAPLRNKAFKLTLQEYRQPLYFFVTQQRVEILSQYEGPLDVALTVAASALAQLQNNGAITELIKSEQLIISGDIKLLQQFAELLTQLDIDWAEHLSHYTGDVIAYHTIENLNKIGTKLKMLKSAAHEQAADYLTQELRLAPSQLEFVHFSDQVACLNQDLIELESRISTLRS